MTVSFDAPQQYGCGSLVEYVIIISSNGDEEIVYVTTDLSNNSFSVPLSNLNVGGNGTVEVYLRTQDTNGAGALDGQSTTVNYVGVTIEQYPIAYQVYENNSQVMELSWSAATAPAGVTLSQYQVNLSLDGGVNYTTVASTSNTVYNYTNAEPCGTTLTFQIVVTATAGLSVQTITSNSQEINVFTYATAPVSVIVDWALINVDTGTTMDLLVHWTNPSSTGCGAVGNFVIEIPSISYSTTYAYDPSATIYDLFINNVTVISGLQNVNVYLTTEDTNSPFEYLDGASNSGSFIAQTLPLITNIEFDASNSQVTFNVETDGDLVLINGLVNVVAGTPQAGAQIYSSGVHANQTVTSEFLPNGIQRYTFTVLSSIFGVSGFGNAIMLAFANAVGVSTEPALVPA